jgi:RNA polymerase sigma factor (sigma-70 family)
VENDYAVLRAYESRCGFATYISVVVQRMALDFRIHAWGKWHASAEAKRLGPLAVELDRLIHRDGRTVDDALVILAPHNPGLTRERLQTLADRLPDRAPKRRDVALDEAGSVAVTRGDAVEEPLLARERRGASERLSSLMTSAINRMPEDERLILQLRFEGGMSVPQIARALQLDQKLLYRRFDTLMRDMRRMLERSGMPAREVLDLVGRDEALLEFHLGNSPPRPSIGADETVAANSEGSQ